MESIMSHALIMLVAGSDYPSIMHCYIAAMTCAQQAGRVNGSLQLDGQDR